MVNTELTSLLMQGLSQTAEQTLQYIYIYICILYILKYKYYYRPGKEDILHNKKICVSFQYNRAL